MCKSFDIISWKIYQMIKPYLSKFPLSIKKDITVSPNLFRQLFILVFFYFLIIMKTNTGVMNYLGQFQVAHREHIRHIQVNQ